MPTRLSEATFMILARPAAGTTVITGCLGMVRKLASKRPLDLFSHPSAVMKLRFHRLSLSCLPILSSALYR
jgi:hypothetical protein